MYVGSLERELPVPWKSASSALVSARWTCLRRARRWGTSSSFATRRFTHKAFDERTLRLQGDPVSLATPVGSFLDSGFFTVSQNDVIAFRPPDKDFQLTWLDRKGQTVGTVGEVGRYSSVAISRDDARVATARETVGGTTSQDIWIHDIARPTQRTSDDQPAASRTCLCGPLDSKRLIFTIGGRRRHAVRAVDRRAE